MSKQRLYHSQFNHKGWKKNKASKSRAHNLRAAKELESLYMQSVKLEEICDVDLIENNLLIIDNKKVNPCEGDKFFKIINDELEKEKKEYLAKLENAYADSNKAELSSRRSKAKAALKRYADNSEGEERNLWNGLIEKLGTEKIDAEQEIQSLKNSSGSDKVKRFNQKLKRILELEKYNNLINVKSRNTEYTIFSKELLYKIPDDTDLVIKPLDLANFANRMNKKLFKDFRVTYITIHSDENPDRPHAHVEFSGKNLKTGEMDIQQQLFKNLQKQYELKNKDFSLAGKSYNTLNTEEVKQFGELYQDFIYEEMNSYLQKNDYKANLEKRTEQEKKADHRQFIEKHLPTQKREHTRAKKLQKLNEKEKEEIKKNQEFNEKAKVEIKKSVIDSISAKQKLEQQNKKIAAAYEELSKIEKLTLNAISALKSAIDFAINAENSSLLDYKKHFLDIKNEMIASQIREQAINIQPDEKQEDEVRKIKRIKLD